MDIKNLNPALTNTRQTDTGRKAEKSEDRDARTSVTTQPRALEDKVSINPLSAEAAQVKQAGDMPDQSEKVQRLKQAIADGTYEVDAKAVAKKLMQTEALFSTL